MSKIQKLFKQFNSCSYRIIKFLKSIASKKFTDFLCGSLKRNIIVYLTLFFVVFGSLAIPGYIQPKKEIQGIAIVDDVIFWCLAAALVAAIGGLIYKEQQAARDVGSTFYHNADEETQQEIQNLAYEGQTSGKYDVSQDLFNTVRAWTASELTDDIPPIEDFEITGGLKVQSPWGSNIYQNYFINRSFSSYVGGALAKEEYDELTKYEQIYLQGSEIMCEWYYDSQVGNEFRWWLKFNGILYSDASWIKSGGKITNVYIDNIYDSTRYYWRYNTATDYSVQLYTDLQTQKPKFFFYKNETNNKTKLAVAWCEYDGRYSAYDLFYNYNGNIYKPEETVNDVNASTIPAIRDDPNYDIIDVQGHRYIAFTDDFGKLINVYPQDIIEGNWADVQTAAIETQTNELKSYFDEYLPPFLYNLDRLADNSDLFSYDETGALRVTGSSGSSTTFPELDIPEVEYNLPTIELLANKFPFCIPFDFYNAISNLNETPEAPVFNVNFPAAIYGGEADMELDFGIFENLAKVIRWIILLGFVIGLILLTRRLIRG